MTQFIYQKLTLIDVKVRIWAGEKTLPKDELDVFKKSTSATDGKNLKNSKAFVSGSILLINPEKLKGFITNRQGLYRELGKFGMPYMTSIGVPDGHLDAAMEKVSEYESEFKKLLSMFIFNYDKWVDEWARSNPDMSDFILANKKPIHDVEAAFRFKCTPYKAAPTADTDEARLQLEETTRELGVNLYEDIAQVAQKAIRDIKRDKREHVSQKIRNTFAGMMKKMEGLAFLDGSILPLCEAMQATIDTLPKEGKITGDGFLTVLGLFTTLSDPVIMKMVGEGKERIKGPAQPGLISMVKRLSTPIAEASAKVTDIPKIDTVQTIPPPATRAMPSLSRRSPMANFKL